MQKLEELDDHLRPLADDEITIAAFIAPISRDVGAYRKYEKEILRAVSVRYWASLIEPHSDGLTHSNFLLRINRNQLARLEKIVAALNAEAGFKICKLSRPSDSENWSRPSKLPGLLGYCGKNAINLDRILSFRVWLAGRRWIRSSSSKIKRTLSPTGFIPSVQHSKNVTESAPTITPTQASTAPNLEEEDTADLERQGRDLNDSLAAAAVEKLRQAEIEKKRKTLWGMLFGSMNSIRKFSSEPVNTSLATVIARASAAADAATLKRFGLKSNALMIFNPSEIQALERATKKAISDWDGSPQKLERIEWQLLPELRKHDHTLKFAATAASARKFIGLNRIEEGDDLYDQLKKQIGHHFKTTGNGHNFRKALNAANMDSVAERLRGTDIRSFPTRSMHGLEPDPTGLVTGSTETKSRKRTKAERALEIRCANELESLREQMALRGRFGKFNLSKAREQASKPVERIDMVKVLKKSIKKGIGIGPILQWSDEKIGHDGTQVILAHVVKVMGLRLSALPVSAA